MVRSVQPVAPRLTRLQEAWLQETGLDKRLLSPFRISEPTVPPKARPALPAQEQGASSVASSNPAPVVPGPAASAAPGLVRTAILLKGTPNGGPESRRPETGRPDSPNGQASVVGDHSIPSDWAALETHVAACQACSLYAGRSQTIFGEGATEATTWMIIGEAPGEHDDRTGLPFQGSAGALLQAMLSAAGIQPDSNLFFTNLIKCRPLGNRTPSAAEIAACLPYLQRQIALLNPQKILALGRLAAQALLGNETDFEQLRGVVHSFRSETGVQIPVVATYHPASLLARSQHKANAWRDLNLARGLSA